MSKTGVTRKTVKLEDFNKIRALVEAGVNYKAIMQVTGRSYSTVHRISRSKTFEDYIKIGREAQEAQQAKSLKKLTDSVTSEFTGVESQNSSKEESPIKTHFSEDSRNLERIASALERLAEAWEAQPKRTGLFK